MSDYWKKKLDELNNNGKNSSSTSDYWQNKMTELEEERKRKKKEEEERKKAVEQENLLNGMTPTQQRFHDKTGGFVDTETSWADQTDNAIKRILGGLDTEYAETDRLLKQLKAQQDKYAREDLTYEKEQVELHGYYNNLLVAKNKDILSKTTMDGKKHSVLEEMQLLTDLSGDEKEKRKEAVFKKMEELGIPTEQYALYTDDSNFNWSDFGGWLKSSASAGLNSFNLGIAKTADLLVGKLLTSVGWENNPVSMVEELYEGMYEKDKFNQQLYAERLGGGAGWSFAGDAAEGTMGAVPNALLALMTMGASSGATTADLTTKAAYEVGNVLTKAGLTVSKMMQNPQYWLSFARTYGPDYEEAKERGASDSVAILGATLTSLVNAGIEIGTDGASGIQGLPDDLLSGNKNKVWAWIESGLEETGEEGLQKFVGEMVTKTLYDHDAEILNPVEYGREMALGAVSGLALGGGQMTVQSGVNAGVNAYNQYQANKLTTDEQTVLDKVVEEKIAEEEQKNGKKLTATEKRDIKKQMLSNLRSGQISIEKIEEIFGGDSYNAFIEARDAFRSTDDYKAYEKAAEKKASLAKMQERYDALVKMENKTTRQIQEEINLKRKIEEIANDKTLKRLETKLRPEAGKVIGLQQVNRGEIMKRVKGTHLAESYLEYARSKEKLDIDINKYTNEYAKRTVQTIVDGGYGNNSNAFKATVDLLAKMSADRGIDILASDSEAINKMKSTKKGKYIHGFVTTDENGTTITLNMDSPRLLQTTVGHEISHVLEKAKVGKELAQAVKNYAITKEGLERYNARIKEAEELYKGDKDTTPEQEVVADLIGEYLFTDSDFVNNLSTQNRNVFMKMFDEIKYFCKIATAGSKEAREFERVKKLFEDAYRENVKGKVGTQLSLENGNKRKYNKRSKSWYSQSETEFMRFERGSAKVGEVRSFNRFGKTRYYEKTESGCVELSRAQYNERKGVDVRADYKQAKSEIGETVNYDESTGRGLLGYNDSNRNTSGDAVVFGQALQEEFSNVSTGSVSSTDGYNRGTDVTEYDDEASGTPGASITFSNDYQAIRNFMKEGDIGEPETKFSMSKDSTGKELSNEQIDFFKDSKAVNEFGELVRVYHGTRKADFTVFKRNATYFTDNKDMADSYSPNGDMYDGYVNITKPFEIDAKGEKWSKIPIDEETKEFLERYGSSVFEEDGAWRTSPADLVAAIEEAIEEGEMDYDGIIIRNVDDTGSYYKDKDSHLATDYITFNSNQFKNVDNTKPTKDPDIRYSMSKAEKAKMDKDYLDAVANNDDDVLKHLVSEYAKQAMPETKLLDENGNPRIVYHGTNTGDFTVFNPDYIGMSSGDDGFFGMGFYFAYSKGEASYYGASRVIPAYLDLKNPFNFDKEFRTYNGKKAMSGHAPDAVALMNFADKFPDIAMSITLDVAKEYGKVESISLFEFSKEFKNVIENKYFEVEETVNEYGEKETIVTADPQTHSYEYNGETHTYRDFGFQKRWYGTPNEYDVAYEYLSNSVYSYIDMPRLTNIILDNNREFTAELKNRGYDGTIQSEYGDEAVVFDPSQIKSAEPITYDDNGEVIPLSKRFDRSNDDIRYSMSKIDEQVNAYEYNLKNGDFDLAEMNVEELANLAMPDSKIRGEDGRLIPLYHGTKEMFWEFDPTIDGGKNGTAEGFGIYLSDDQEVTNAYGDRQIKMFANITKPATSFDKTISSGTLVKLIKDTCERQAQQMVEEEGYDSLEDALRDTWISNYVMTYDMSIEQAYRTVANDILKTQTNDKDIIHEVMFGMAIRDYARAMDFYRNSLTPVTGFDGFVTKWENNGKTSNIYMAFDSSQLKSADAVTKDDNGNVIPITERFNFDKKDIRYFVSKDGSEIAPNPMYEDGRYLGYRNSVNERIRGLAGDDIAPADDLPIRKDINPSAPVTDVDESDIAPEMGEMFPDDTALLRGELSAALTEKEVLEERLQVATKNLARAGSTEQDLRAFEEASNAYDAVVARIEELEQKVNRDSFSDFTDVDAPVEAERFDDSLPGVTQIGKGDISNIANEVGKTLALNSKQKAEFRKLIEDYSNSDNPSREQLFKDIKEKFGTYTERVFEKTISEAKKYLRTTKLYLSDTIVGDIADFADFKYRNRGKVILSQNGGLEVDAAYKEMNSYWPHLFPESIANPTDQLLQMVDVASTASTTRIDTPIDDKTLWEVANDVADSVAETKRLQQEADRDKLSSDAFDSLMQEANANEQAAKSKEVNDPAESSVSKKVENKIRNLQTELDKNREHRQKALKDFDDEIAKLQSEYDAKKNKTVRSANDLLRRIERLRRMRNNTDADYANRISRLEARIEKMNSPEYRTSEHRKSKMQEHTDFWEATLGDTSTWKDMALGLAYKTKTLRRILRKVVRDANGKPDYAKADAIYDALETKYDHNEAQLKKESVKLKEVFKKLNLNHTEDTYAHMLGEFRHNPQTTLTEDVVNEYYEKHKNKINTEKVNKAIEESRKTFDELIVRVNQVLKEQGMKEIPYRKGYFPHFTNPKQGWLAKLLNWKTIDTEIPTSIAGLTEQFDPQRSWQGFNKQRKGDTTDYSLYQGLDTYIHGALDWIYHIDDLQSRRALENYIRYIHSEEGVKAKIDEIKANDYLDADQTQVAIDAVLAEAKNPLNNLVTELRARTNTLANKKASMDRGMEEATNRKIYSTMTNLNNRINANMVVGSISSALTNFIPMVQSWHQVSPVYTVKGLGDFVRSVVHDDGMVAKSDYLTNRLVDEEKLYQTGWDKVSDKAAWLMNTIDNITSQTVWRSKYLQNLHEGMSESEAIKDADQFAKNLMAGRSRGNAPSIFDAKNPIIKIATAFQLEVANQYGFMFEDTPQDVKSKARLVKGYAAAFLGAYMYNALYSSLVGRDAAFDPISIIEDLFGDLFDDDDDDEDDVKDALLGLGENIVQELPYVGGLVGGGRVPMSSALPYSGDSTPFESMMTDVTEGNWDSVGKELLKPLYYLAMPVGGGQIKKTVEGLSMFDDDLPISGSYTDSGKLRFPVEKNVGNVVQAAVFGQYASKNAREYFDEGYAPLSEKQIQEYMDVDIPISDYWKYRKGLKGKDSLGEKLAYIDSLDLPIRKQNILANNLADREEPINMADWDKYDGLEEYDYAKKYPEKHLFLEANGISVKQYNSFDDETKDAWSWAYKNPGKYAMSKAVTSDLMQYRRYANDLGDIRADKDIYGNAISGSAKQKKLDYINSLNIDYGAKLILYKSQYKTDNLYNYEIVEYLNSIQEFSYEDRIEILKELGFTIVGDGTVQWD